MSEPRPILCPNCYHEIDLNRASEDADARRFAALLARLDANVSGPLLAYVGLFKPRKSRMAWHRAIRIADEALALCPDARILGIALADTVVAMRAKQLGGKFKPLSNHNYLAQVLQSTLDAGAPQPRSASHAQPQAPRSKAAQAAESLATHTGPQDAPPWLVRVLCQGLADLLPLSLEGTPAADQITRTADALIQAALARRSREWDEARHANALKTAFEKLITDGLKRWPQPADILDRLPSEDLLRYQQKKAGTGQ